MQIDRRSIERLLTLNDKQLSLVISKLLAESGIDPASFNVDPKDISSVRRVLGSASEEDLRRVTEQYEEYKKRGGKGIR
jgi:hypothetical protein